MPFVFVSKSGMSAKSSGLFEGKKGNKKGAAADAVTVKGSKGLISLRSLSIRRASEGDGKHAFMVALGFEGSDSLLLSRCKKFRCDDDLGFDDANARVKAVQFAASTDEIPVFRAFVLEDGCGLGYGSSAVTTESIVHLRDDINVRICEQGRLQSREACEPVSYVCLRKNVRAGLIFAVAMVRLESGQHRSISFQMQRRHDGEEDEYVTGDEELLTRAFNFLRSAAFEIWSKDGSNRASGQGDQAGSHHRERGLKHPFSYIGIEDGEKVDCCCGKNRSKGLMVACEECGVWEHAECLGYRFNSQIPADYICSACLRAQNEEVVFIRLDEQGQSQIQCSDDLLNDSKESEAFGSAAVCCVCGCEDNEDFEIMIHPCSCAGGLAIAHLNCVLSAVEGATLKERAKKAASFRCPLCGGQGIVVCGNDDTLPSSQSGKEISPPKPAIVKRNTRRSSNSEQSSKGVKRLRSALVHPGIEGKNELTEKSALSSIAKHEAERQAIHSGKKIDILPAESLKPETSVTGKRFADAAVTVPIKKRRIQLMEAVRSPSPPPRPPSPSLQSDDLVFHDETAKKVAGNTDGNELQNVQVAEISESSLDEDTEGMALMSLKAGSSNRKTELGKEQLSQAGKKELGKSGVNLSLPVAQPNSVQEEIEGTLTKELKTLEVQLHVEACKDLIKIAGPDNNVGLSSYLEKRRDLQASQVLTAACSALEVLHNDVSHGGSPLWKLSSGMNSGCQIAKDGENDQELQRKIKEGSTTNSSATADELQEQLNMIVATREMQEQHKVIHGSHIVEQQSSSEQISDESGNVNIPLRNRDDRSHWDLNMEMEAWEQPCAKLSYSDPTLGRVEVSTPMVHSDSHEDGEVRALPINEDATQGRNVDAENLLPEATEEKPRNELSTSLETLPAAKQIASCSSLESDHVVATEEPILNSEAFNQSKFSSRQIYCYEEEKLEDDSSGGLAKLSSSLSSMNSSLEANALSDERELEGKIISRMDDDTKYQLPASVGFTTDVAVDALEPVSQHIPSAGNLATTLTMGATLNADTIMSVQIEAKQHSNCPDPSLEIDTLDHTEGCKTINSQNDPLKDVNKDSSDAETIREKAIKIGDKRESIEVDALEEDGQGADSSRRFISDGDDSQGKFSKMRLADWDEGAEDYLEAEDVDYGDSENEVEQGHEDGETYNLEVDEVTSACSQEHMDFGDDEIDNHDDIQEYAEEEGQIIQWVDSVDDKKLDAGHEEQYNSDTELEIAHNGEDANLETNELIQGENADIQDTQTISEELAGSVRTVKKDKEGSKDGDENAFDAPSSSKKISSVRTKSSGWDQLPEGFEKAEDALRAVKENSVRIGRGAFRGGFLSGPRRGSPFSMNTGPVERGRMDVFGRSSSTRQYDFRMDDNSVSNFTSSRRLGLGRSRGRSGSPVVLRERSRLDPWADDYGGPPGQWAPKRHSSPPVRFREASGFGQHGQANAAAIAAAKLESSGFLVAPDGTITKAGSANNALRGSPRPFSGGGRRSGGMMFNSGRGALVRGEMNLGRRVGLGTGRGFGFGSDNISMNMGASPGARGRLGLNNREMIEPYRFAPHCVGNSVGEPSFGRPILDHSEKWNRRERHFSPASRKQNRISPPRSYRRSSSTSRSRSPRLRTPPRFGNGGSGNVLRRSRSPLHVRSVVKGDSRESSPSGRRSVPPPPKLPLPPPPPRGQRSPPAGLKRLSDRREGDRRYSDLEQTTSVAQSHRTPPRRLSSHIEQTAAISDEPDLQSLPSMQNSVLEKHKSSYTLERISRSGSGRNLASMESFGKVNSEVQLLSDDEYGDGAARKGESSRHRLKDAYRLDKNDKDKKVDASFYRTKWEKNDSRIDLVKSRRDGRAGSYSRYSSNKEVDDEIAPRRRRAPS